MDYKQKYEQALGRVRTFIKRWEGIEVNTELVLQELKEIFPELKESKDEKIRNVIRGWIYTRPSSFFDNGISKEEMLAWLEKQGEEKTADRIEPKFKVGDWIYHEISGNIIHINKIENDVYVSDEGATVSLGRQNDWELWTIQDANDGDVLEFGDHGKLVTGIVSFVNERTGKVDVSCLLEDNKFKVGNFYTLDTIEPHPATKEQRNLLFQKMKEAGYDWDAKKKELKKIEQKPAFCHHEVDLSGCSEEYRKAYYDGWNNCNQQHSQLKAEQKSAWSEEDEEKRIDTIKYLEMFDAQGIHGDVALPCITWLKSLKKRIKGE